MYPTKQTAKESNYLSVNHTPRKLQRTQKLFKIVNNNVVLPIIYRITLALCEIFTHIQKFPREYLTDLLQQIRHNVHEYSERLSITDLNKLKTIA